MNAKQAIRFLRQELSDIPTTTVFEVEQIDSADMPEEPKPIAIVIRGTFHGETCAGLLLIHPYTPFNPLSQKWLKANALRITIAIVSTLDERLRITAMQNAAKNN